MLSLLVPIIIAVAMLKIYGEKYGIKTNSMKNCCTIFDKLRKNDRSSLIFGWSCCTVPFYLNCREKKSFICIDISSSIIYDTPALAAGRLKDIIGLRKEYNSLDIYLR